MAGTTQEKELDQGEDVVVETKVKYMSPGECRSHMRRTLTREFQSIVDGFVEAAKKGSCPHVKLATELLKPIRKNPSRKKGSVAKYIEELDRAKLERERIQKERLAAEQVTEARDNVKLF